MNKLNKLEWKWVLYDVGNSAFILLSTTIIPIVFNSLAKKNISETDYLAYWGYGISISTIIVVFLGPLLGTFSDRKNHKKPMFLITVFLGVCLCSMLPLFNDWIVFLIVFIGAKICFNISLIFYDSMLTDITSESRMDVVSSYGYAWGYIGSCIPFVIAIGIIFGRSFLNIDMSIAVLFAFLITGTWWLLFSLPLISAYNQINYSDANGKAVYKELLFTIKDLKNNKKVFFYLLSFFFYIDGVYTIIDMSTVYATSLGIDSNGLIMALLVTQIVAFPCALFFARISRKYKTETLLMLCIIAYAGIALYAISLDKLYEFWILAISVGVFQGAIQALSRSYYAKIIPATKSGEYFGLFDICGKGASVIGTMAVSLMAQITKQQNLSLSVLVVMFILGLFMFRYSLKFD